MATRKRNWGDSRMMAGSLLQVVPTPKNAHLRQLWTGPWTLERLLLFKADMPDPDALAAAVAGCEGVASPVSCARR